MRELLALGRPLVIGHAGGDRSWPHSTMYAFSQAAFAGVDVLEMDLQMTADRVLVVHHDDTVDRTTNATGRVRDMTYEELKALDNAYWWSEEWPSHDLPSDAYTYRESALVKSLPGGVRPGRLPGGDVPSGGAGVS